MWCYYDQNVQNKRHDINYGMHNILFFLYSITLYVSTLVEYPIPKFCHVSKGKIDSFVVLTLELQAVNIITQI